jgi:glycosyltransferase involved in cell wall biosynthesis
MQRCLLEHGIESHVVSVPVLAPSRDFTRRPSREPTFLYCGRLSREKGVAVLLRAFGRLLEKGVSSARLRIAGDGAEAAALKSLAANLGLSDAVSFLGWQRLDGVERELSSAWACVAPSIWAEPQGLTAVEAMVRGVPVIASETGGFGENVRHGATGLLFPNGDEEALAGALHKAAVGAVFPEHTLRAEHVRATAELFSVDRHVQLMREILAGAAGTKGEGRR